MKKLLFEKPAQQLLFSLFVVLNSLLVFIFIGYTLAAIFAKDLATNMFLGQYNFESELGVATLKYLQAIQSVGMFVVAPLLMVYFFSATPFRYLGFNRVKQGRVYFLAVAVLLAGIPVLNAMGFLNMQLSLPSFMHGIEEWMRSSEEMATRLTASFLVSTNISGLAVNFLLMAFIPAFGEEMLFRGVFQNIFIRWTRNIHWGIIITAFLFSAMHMQFFTFLPRLAIGVLLGYLFVWTGSIWVPIVVHFVNNAMAIAIASFSGEAFNQSFYETVGTNSETWGYAMVSLMGVSVLLFLLLQLVKMDAEKST